MKKALCLGLMFLLALSAQQGKAGWFGGGGGGAAGDATSIQGVSIGTPGSGDDGKYVQYEHSDPAQQFQYATPAGGGDMDASVWDGDSDGFIDADAGGTDINTSASTGVPSISSGTWSVGATLIHELGGLEADVSAYSGLVHITGGTTSAKSASANGLSLIAAADYAAMRTLLDLEAGTDFYSMTAADTAFEAELDNSAGLLAALDDETGTGLAVFGTSPTLTGFTLAGDINSTAAAYDWDLVDTNASALSFDTDGKAGILSISTLTGAESVSMSGRLYVTGVGNFTGGMNLTGIDGQLLDLSGITHSASDDEGLVLPTWADVTPASDKPFIAWDGTGNALQIYDGGWISIAATGAPVNAKYIVQQADAVLTAEQALGALASGILYNTTTTGVLSIAAEADLETTLGIGFGTSKVATSGYMLIADDTDFESVPMSGDVTITASGVTTVADDSHAHIYSNIDETTSANWAGRVSDETGSGVWVFGTAPTFTTSVSFNAVTDTIAGIQNQNLLDKTAAEAISGIYTHSADIVLDDGSGASPGVQFIDEANETWTVNKANSGDLDIAINNASDRTVHISNAGAGDAGLVVDGTISINGSGASLLGMSNNDGGLSPSGYRIYFETDVSDVLSYCLNGSEKRVVNQEDAQTIAGVKTFTSRQICQGDVDVGDASNAGSLRLFDGSDHYIDLQTEALSANRTWSLPDGYGSANQAFLSHGDGTFGWGNPSAAPAGSDTEVQFNDSGSTGADAGFVYNKTTDTLMVGENGVDGILALYEEIGSTDYVVSLKGNASMAGNITITMPAAAGTVATLGNAETFSGAKTFTAAITASTSVITPLVDAPGATALTFGSADVTSWTFSGVDETLILTPSADTVTVSSGTGVAELNFSALNLITTGEIHGGIEQIEDDSSLSAAQCYGSVDWHTGAETITLPAALKGMSVMIYSTDATVKTIDPNGTENIWLNGVDQGDGVSIDSPGAIGDFITLVCRSNGNWYTVGRSGVWVVTP